jgi:hypothetical protein
MPRPESKQYLSATALLGSLALALAASPAAQALVINPTFESLITSDPNAAAIEGTINSAIGTYEANFTDPITVSIDFNEMSSGLGLSSTFFAVVPYAAYLAALTADAKSSADATAIAHLPTAAQYTAFYGTPNIDVKTANLRAVGIPVSPPSGQPDGFIRFNTSITSPGSPGSSLQFSLLTVIEHEIDEVLGIGSALPNPPFGNPFPEDLFRYDAAGNRSFTANSAATAFFSINGTTDLAQFDNQNDGGDFGDWQSNPRPAGTNPQVQDAFATAGATPSLGVELTALDVIGYDRAGATPVPEPSSLAMLLTGLAGLGLVRRRRRV